MNIRERLEKNKAAIEAIVGRINKLDQERQELLQEALRLDGEARILKSFEQEEKGGN